MSEDGKEIQKTVGIIKSFDGTPIYYESRGAGETIVFIYGIACLMNHWHHQVDYFSKTNRVITFDLRGHHKSFPLTHFENLSTYDLAHDIKCLLSALGVEKAHIVGHSFGVTVALAMIDKYPELVHSATFVNGFSRNPIKGMFGLDLVEKFYHFARQQYNQNADVWNTLWRLAVDNPVSMHVAALVGGFNIHLTQFKDIEVYARGVAHMDIEIFLRLFEELMRFDGTSLLPNIEMPVLIVSGEADTVTPKKFQEEFRELIPNSEFVSVPYGSHCTQLDFPDYFNLKLHEFITKHRMVS